MAPDDLPRVASHPGEDRVTGYQVSYRLYDAADFGVPQHRRRVIFLLSRDGEKQPMVPTHGGAGQPPHSTVRGAISLLSGTVMEAQRLTPAVLRYLQYIPAGGN